MSAPFKVGDVVIGQHFTVNLECNGQEAVVISAVEFGGFRNADGTPEECNACEILWADGAQEWQKPYHLRLRKPPAADSGERLIATLIRETLDKAPQRVGETV